MTETERKGKVNEKEKVQDLIYKENLIPELYALYKEGKIDRRSVDEFICADPEVQRSILHCLSIERPVVPEGLLDKHEHEIASIEARHKQDLNAEREKLAEAEAEKKKQRKRLSKTERSLRR